MEFIRSPTDLCIPIYLDQEIVFDLLAMLDNGFSQVNTINTSITGTKTGDSKKGASLSGSALNLFSFSVNGDKCETNSAIDNEQQTMTKTHTTSSMFSILRRTLRDENFISPMNTMDDINNLKCGNFVEFRSKLTPNPLMDSFNRMREVSKLCIKYSEGVNKMKTEERRVESPQEKDQNRRKTKHKGPNNQTDVATQENQTDVTTQENQNDVSLFQWIYELSDELLSSNSTEIIGNIFDHPEIKVDLPAKVNCFVNNDTSIVMNGEFSVFGKVTQVISCDSKDTIDLLQKTTLKSFGEEVIKMFTDSFSHVPNNAIIFPKITTKINGPAIQVLPIAIFI